MQTIYLYAENNLIFFNFVNWTTGTKKMTEKYASSLIIKELNRVVSYMLIPPPPSPLLSHSVTKLFNSLPPLQRDIIYECPLRGTAV